MEILLDTKYLGIAAGALVGVLLGSVGMYVYLSPRFASANEENSVLFNSLNHDYNELETLYNELKTDHDDLISRYDSLEQLNSELAFERNMYSNNYDETLKNLKDLSDDILVYRDTLESCSDTEKALGNVLGLGEVQKVGSKVTEVTMSTKKKWLAYARINDFILNQIASVKDVPFPCISKYTFLNQKNDEVIVGIDMGVMENQMQTPVYTIENKQGDSDDQAALECAMIQFYDHYIINNQTKIYYCLTRFSDESRHSCVIIPDGNGLVCILDPAGNYLTSDNGWANADTASSELSYYREHWASQGYYITSLELYEVRSIQGYYKMVCETDVQGAIDFFSP
jgi:hypothetical protein